MTAARRFLRAFPFRRSRRYHRRDRPVACGKSTLGRVFLCERPYGGSVRIGGRELSELSPREAASTVGYLGHDPELWNDTVEENVRCGEAGDAMRFLALTALDGEVRAMERGLQTVVGSGGVRLSGGQAQRLALARTLAHPRPVLVLDDPFSALDRQTEDEVFARLKACARSGHDSDFAQALPFSAAQADRVHAGRKGGRGNARGALRVRPGLSRAV